MVTGAFTLLFLPAALLMAVWTAVNVARLLFPERDLPFDGPARRAAARRGGAAVPVRAFDVVEDLRRRPVRPAMPPPRGEAVPAPDAPGTPTPLAEDLWLRRN
jgi:hypothetical protein